MGSVLKGIGVVTVLGVAFLLFDVIVHSSSGHAAWESSAGGTSPSCTASDFSVVKTKAQSEYDEAKLTGIVTNNCSIAAGVQLKWTAYNRDGSVAFSSDFWPASTTNIPAHSAYSFEMMEAAPRGRWTYRVEPISIQVW